MNLDLGDIILNKHTASKESLISWPSLDKIKSTQTTKMLQIVQVEKENEANRTRLFESFMETSERRSDQLNDS